MERLAVELRNAGVDFLIVSDSVEAAVHAGEKGLIRDDAIQSVRRDKDADER